MEPTEIADQMTQLLQSRKVYLRVGLSRGWKKFPDRCYLQINAIYTSPDYLEGKTFFDFFPGVRFLREEEGSYEIDEVPL